MGDGGSSVRQRLRARTRALHAGVDAQMQASADVGTPTGYVAHLEIMHATMQRFASNADRGAEIAGVPCRARRLIGHLEADLLMLGSCTPGQIRADDVRDDAYALGVAYALEGSALGAALLAPTVALPSRNAMAYLEALQHERGGRWSSTVTTLNAVSASDTFDGLVHGASDVFHDVQARVELYAACAR